MAAFENEGFIWGGKWHEYDLMHFEYRPEIICKARVLQGQGHLPATEIAGPQAVQSPAPAVRQTENSAPNAVSRAVANPASKSVPNAVGKAETNGAVGAP